jgi:hypothetical protein
MAPKYNSPLKTTGIFEQEQISIDVTVTSPVSLPTIRCAEHKIYIKERNGRRRPLPRSTVKGDDGVILCACKYVYYYGRCCKHLARDSSLDFHAYVWVVSKLLGTSRDSSGRASNSGDNPPIITKPSEKSLSEFHPRKSLSLISSKCMRSI